MTIKLKKQVIEIFDILKKKSTEIVAEDLAEELNIDYIVLMSAVNDLIAQDLGGFKEKEIYNVSPNKEGRLYLEKGFPERQLLNLILESDVKEISLKDLMKKSGMEGNIFYVGISNLKKNRWISQSKASGENKIFLIAEEFPQTEIEKFFDRFKENSIVDYSELSKQ
ncbi:MAG: hypothetical protein ACXADU_17830, partial [Promethearchaeota archaeon]